MQRKILELETLIGVPYVDPDLGFDISPDGKQVAFSWNRTGQWEIYTLALDKQTGPKQISGGPGAKFAPKWRPDGRVLGYVCDLDGGEVYDLQVYDFETGESRNLTGQIDAPLVSSFSWSPDGEQIAISFLDQGYFTTFIMPAAGGELRKALSVPYHDFGVTWSPDGRWLAIEVEGAVQDYFTYLVSVADLEVTAIALDDAPISAQWAVWSPDSKSLAFASNISGQHEIGIYRLEDGAITWLTSGAGEKNQPDWSPDGRQLVYVLNHGPDTHLALHNLPDQSEQVYQLEPGVIYRPAYTPAGDQIVFVFDNPRHPDDLWAFMLADGEFKQLSDSLPPEINPDWFIMPEEVRYPGLDGELVPALVYRPAREDSLPPGVVNVHGGPNWLFQITWDPFTQHMASRGWVVLAPNYRGSTGYGKAWQLASRFDLGGVDTRDVVAGADYLADNGIADPARIAVTGRSWGGYLTMTCLTQYPDRWAAGSASVPFLNWFTSHANSREDLQHWDIENFGRPDENHDLWYAHSPYFFLDRITAPVQLVCGENDVRCPASESQQAYEELTRLGKVCDYVLVRGEGHAFLKKETQLQVKTARVEFMARYLEKDKG